MITNKSEHALSLDEVDGEKDFASFIALYRVYLSDRDVRMLIEESVEILKSAIDAALLVDLEDATLLPGLEPDLARQIDVFRRNGSCIDEAIDRPLADHDRVPVVDTNVMRRLALLDKRSDHGIELSKLFLGEGEPGSGLRTKFFVIPLSVFGLVKHFLKTAFSTLVATIADKWRSFESPATSLPEFRTGAIAQSAVTAVLVVLVGIAYIADILPGAVIAVSAGIVVEAQGPRTVLVTMLLDLPGYSGRMLANRRGYGADWKSLV
jgi:hypothetical protein